MIRAPVLLVGILVIRPRWWLPETATRRLPRRCHLVGYYRNIPQNHLLSSKTTCPTACQRCRRNRPSITRTALVRTDRSMISKAKEFCKT